MNAIPATATGEQEAQRARLLTQHAKQVRSHVDALASKSYWTGLEASPDFTIAFIPNEPLLAAAMETDPNLMDYAFSKRTDVYAQVAYINNDDGSRIGLNGASSAIGAAGTNQFGAVMGIRHKF